MHPFFAATSTAAAPTANLQDSLIGRLYGYLAGHESTAGSRILLIVVLAAASHVIVKGIRTISDWAILRGSAEKSRFGFSQKPKFITVTRLVVTAVTFAIYFLALGLVLQEFGVNLTAYLASASILGLAISFGSQGLIQDIVIGLTLIFWDAMDVGDMVEVTSTATVQGRVEEIGMRFTKFRNVYNQEVFVPNRTIANVSRYPHGGVDAFADIQVPAGVDAQKASELAEQTARGMWVQFDAIILGEPVVSKLEQVSEGGWSFIRVHFRIWPGQGGLIETTFRQQVTRVMKAIDPNFADWQVPVTYRATTKKTTMAKS